MTTTTSKRDQRDPMDLIGLAVLNTVWWAFIAAGVAVWWAVLFPMISIPLGLAVAAGLFFGWPVGVVVVGVFIAGMVLWRAKRPETFERWVSRRARRRFLTWFRYRRRWIRLMTACGLSIERGEHTLVPPLRSVEIGESVDRLRVRMLEGHCPADWENRVEHLAHAFGAPECRAAIVGPGTVELVFRQRDSLAEPIALPGINGDHRWGKGNAA
ncbi:hypothetical protein ACQPXH_26140 [Nocardia sp. CA-135953]|uniref:hypothetical protein n=1 Tax=Nocardia sp. CA-135953 TaxID=3239978 RepID=UPI003D96E44C